MSGPPAAHVPRLPPKSATRLPKLLGRARSRRRSAVRRRRWRSGPERTPRTKGSCARSFLLPSPRLKNAGRGEQSQIGERDVVDDVSEMDEAFLKGREVLLIKGQVGEHVVQRPVGDLCQQPADH